MTSIAQSVQLACLWEVSARKLGNVHRFRDFQNVSYMDFLHSSLALGLEYQTTANQSLGEKILSCMKATQEVVQTNTNLGIILLLVPLAETFQPNREDWQTNLAHLLQSTTVQDAEHVYEAIRLAHPGGLGRVENQDISDKPTLSLLEVMLLAKDRDSIARQYAENFIDIFDWGVPQLEQAFQRLGSIEAAILATQVAWLAREPDSLIVRKAGLETAQFIQTQAQQIVSVGLETEEGKLLSFALDKYLRSQGNQRNPGTTADLITSCLFVALEERKITISQTFFWSDWPREIPGIFGD